MMLQLFVGEEFFEIFIVGKKMAGEVGPRFHNLDTYTHTPPLWYGTLTE